MAEDIMIPETEESITQEWEQQDPPSKALWKKLHDSKAYTNSYEEFQKKYSTPRDIDALHQKLSAAKAYTNPKQDFYSKYFPEKKNTGSNDLPTVSGNGSSTTPKADSDYPFDKVLNPYKQQASAPLPQPVTPKNKQQSDKYLDANWMTVAKANSLSDAKSKDMNLAGNLWNSFTTGIGRLGASGADLAIQALNKVLPSEEGLTDEQRLKKLREDVAEPTRTATTELVGANVTPEQKATFDKNMVASTVGGLVEMIPAIGGKGLGLLLQAYDHGMESINSTEEGRKLPENVKTIFSGTTGLVVGAMDRLSLTKIFGKQSSKIAAGVTIKVLSNLIKKSEAPLTSELVQAAILAELKSLKSTAINGGKKLIQAATIEGGTEGIQEGVTMLAENILNKSQDKEVFEEKSWKETLDRVAKAVVQGGIGGTLLGGVSLPFSKSKDYIADKVANAKSESDIASLKEELMASAQSQELDEAETQNLSETIDNYIRINRKVPDGIPNRKEVVDKIAEREDVQSEIESKKAELENVDEAFQGELREDIEMLENRAKEINEELAEPEKLTPEPEPVPVPENTSTVSEPSNVSTIEAVREPSQEQQLQDMKEGNVVTFTYKNDAEVPDIFKDKISSRGETNGEPIIRVTIPKSLADYHLQSEAKPSNVSSEEVKNEVANILGVSGEEAGVLSMIYHSKLSPDEKKIMYRQFKNGVMNKSDIEKYTVVNLDDLKNDKGGINKWANAILEKNKSQKGNIDAEDISFEEVKSETKPISNEGTKAEIPKPTEEASTPSETVDSNIGAPAEAENKGGGGEKPPIIAEGVTTKEPSKFEEKGILNRLVKAEKVPEVAKRGFEEKGLKYEPQTQKEAEGIGKAMVDEYGIDEAVALAEAAKFKGGVNSAIFADSLNRLFNEEQSAKTPEAKLEAAKKFAEIGIRYDEFSRGQGRDISQISHFYKKSPLGIKIMEETRRREQFDEFSKKKDQSWKEFFDEMTKDPDFEKEFKTKVSEELKKERAELRAKRIKKVDDMFDDAIKKLRDGGQAYSTFIPIPPKALALALEGMKKAYHGGEKVVKIIADAIDYINKEVGTGWDTEVFRKEWEQKLGEHETKTELPEEKRERVLERFRKKLKGLSEKEKDEVIRKAFKKLIENGALDYADFKKIIADTLGYGEMTPEQAKRIVDLVGEINKVDDVATKVRDNDRSQDALKEYQDAKKKAEKAATELGKIVFNKVDISKRLLSVMQLNTLGIPSLINNPIFNVFNQATVRLPRSIIMTAIDYAAYGIGKVFGKDLKPENNVIQAQMEFYSKMSEGAKQSTEQLFTGLTNKDYFQKEVYASQIHPATSAIELWNFFKGKSGIKLSKGQIADKAIQATVGVPAEIVARVLNIGDKPQRFAAEGAQAATFAKNLGLQGIDYKLFMEFPKEEAYRKLKKDGLSDEAAMKKAEEIQQRIINEGEESTFQQDNLLNDAITAAFKPFGKAGDLVKTLNMPFVKIPLNAFWSVFNLANPEVALLQSMVYSVKAFKSKSPLDVQASKKWFAHAVTGIGWMAVTGALAKAGIVNPANDDDTTKKEREGEMNYEQQNSINISKFQAMLRGENPDDVKDGLMVDLKWLGNMGILMGYQAAKLEKLTPEQKETGMEFTEEMLTNLHESALDFMDKGVFSNTGAMFTAINKGGGFMDAYLINLMNMGTNIVQPASFAQISRAQLPYYSKAKADTFMETVENSMLSRSSFLRKITDQYPPSKVGIWGDQLDKKGNTVMRLFGISKSNDDNFAQPLYGDYKKTNNTKFFPSAVKPEIVEAGTKIKLNSKEALELETLVGQARKQLVAPYVNDMAKFEGDRKKYSELSEDEKTQKLQILYEVGYQSGEFQFRMLHPEYKTPPLTPKKENEKMDKQDANEELRQAAKDKIKLEN